MSNLLRISVVASALALVSISTAQEMPKPQWIVVTTSKIKPDARQAFESFQKEASAAYKQAGVPFRAVYETVLGDLAEYTAVYPIPDFASLDGPTPMEKALGKDGSAKLLQKGRQYISEIRRMALVMRPDLSVVSNGGPQPFEIVSRITLAVGKNGEYDRWTQSELIPAMKKGGVNDLWTYMAIFGGGAEYVQVAPIPNMAVIDGGHPAWKMEGGRAASDKMFARTAGLVSSQETSIVKLRPDLSHIPAPATGK